MRLTAGALLLMFSCAVVAGTPLPDGPHIVVSGEGKVSVEPDSARIVFNFEQRAGQALPAKQTVDRRVNDLLDGASRFGIAGDDIRASDLTTNEDVLYGDDDRRISNGYVATRSVTVVLHEVERLNEFLDFGLAAGASGISQVVLESTRASALRTEAKKKAVNSVREKGSEMAKAFGAKLGTVYSIDSIGSRQGNGWVSGMLDSIQVTGGRREGGRYLQPTVEYSETVSAVFELAR
jgi:uncharacterized protein